MYIVSKQKYLCCFLKYLDVTCVAYNDSKPQFNYLSCNSTPLNCMCLNYSSLDWSVDS